MAPFVGSPIVKYPRFCLLIFTPKLFMSSVMLPLPMFLTLRLSPFASSTIAFAFLRKTGLPKTYGPSIPTRRGRKCVPLISVKFLLGLRNLFLCLMNQSSLCHLLQLWTSTSCCFKVVITMAPSLHLISLPTIIIYSSSLPIPLFLFVVLNLCFPLNFIVLLPPFS